MEQVQELINWLLVILPVGVGITVVRCIIGLNLDPDSEQTYKKRIRNALIFMILAESIVGLIKVIAGYY